MAESKANKRTASKKKLVIVESPTKVESIKKYLGSGYDIEATMGHVRDLPRSAMGVDVDNDFEPKYITIRGKGDLIAKLKKKKIYCRQCSGCGRSDGCRPRQSCAALAGRRKDSCRSPRRAAGSA